MKAIHNGSFPEDERVARRLTGTGYLYARVMLAEY
jgi:hypothetical protein